MNLRLLVVDDHPVFCSGLKSALSAYEINTWEAYSPEQAMDYLRQNSCDAALVDIRLKPHDGFELLKNLRKEFPSMPVVMFSMHEHPLFLSHADKLGAAGFLLKTQTPQYFADTFRLAVRTGRAFTREQVLRMNSAQNVARLGVEYDAPLTMREVEILNLIGNGQTNKKIADNLDISSETVKEHVQNILFKIGVVDRTQAVYWALKNGVLNYSDKLNYSDQEE